MIALFALFNRLAGQVRALRILRAVSTLYWWLLRRRLLMKLPLSTDR
jgi:hypothetical protein